MKIVKAIFPNKDIEKNYEQLEHSKNEQERNLYKHITCTISILKQQPEKGKKIARKLWPKEYVKKYEIESLYKINLPNGWRLIYSIKGNNIIIFTIILEWLKHKDYEKKFNYTKQ